MYAKPSPAALLPACGTGDKPTGARERSKYRLDERLGLLSQIEIQAW